MPYWDERVAGDGRRAIPTCSVDHFHIDILTAHFVQRPQFFDVVVASNLFGDILSDLGPACTGTIGIAPSANINPDARASLAVRAGARLGAGHRRARHRQSDRADLVGRADARLPGPPRRARRDHRGDRDRARPGQRRARSRGLGGTASTADLGRAIAERVVGAPAVRSVPAVKHEPHERRKKFLATAGQ